MFTITYILHLSDDQTATSQKMTSNAGISLSFQDICSLLGELESLRNRYRAPNSKLKRNEFLSHRTDKIRQWAEFYSPLILNDSQSILATLSLLFPYLARARVYFMNELTLSRVLAKALGTDEGKFKNWRLNDGDIGITLEKIMKKRVKPQ
jgi:hypothetical protein